MNQSPDSTITQPFQFTGTGSEYFRIWIVNLALTILTFGIYSAWAKVRRLQYFYRNTSLASGSFDFHGDPKAILKGRLIAVGLLVAYNVIGTFNVVLGLIALVALLAAVPWLVQRSLRFKLYNSSYRGLRFRFTGSLGGAYRTILLWPIVGYLTAGILMPFAHREIKHYQHTNSRFGDTTFSFTADAGQFYIIYLKLLGMLLLALLGFVVLAAGLFVTLGQGLGGSDPEEPGKWIGVLVAVVLAFYLLLFLLFAPWFSARIQNLVWSHTALGPHGFMSNVRARDLLAIYVTNFIGIVLTLGLFKPFADVRLARYRLSRMALAARSDLNEFLAAQGQAVSAMGEETADVFDVDISF
jgi:uncharacterized membrane protein YjgN (DUF898 family)